MDFNQLVIGNKKITKKRIAIAVAENRDVIEAIKLSLENDLASFVLYGDEKVLRTLLKKERLSENEGIAIVHATDDKMAATGAVKAVSSGHADILMKGMVSTATLLSEVLNKDYGLRKGNILSHIAAFRVPGFNRTLYVTDAAMNISPNLAQKAKIVQNAVDFIRCLGVDRPKVAALAAVEVVNPKMQATLDAMSLVEMASKGEIKNCDIDGPLALDNAISTKAAEYKGIKSTVAGVADILFVPSIEVGNVLYKSLIYFAQAEVGALITGASAPIVLTSRADSAKSKLNSIALAVLSLQQSK